MNYARIVLAGIAAWLASIVLGYLINDIWLLRLYRRTPGRSGDPRTSRGFPIGLGAQLVACLAFAFAYAKGYEGGGSHIGKGCASE